MGSLNRVQLIGRLGADPELKYLANGTPVCNFSVATSESWKDKASGEKKETTTWHKIQVWRELAEVCTKYLAKGREVYVEGKIQTRSYDKNGVKHYATDIVADKVVFLGGGNGERAEGGGSETSPRRGAPEQPPSGNPPADDIDDVPFVRLD